MRIFLINLDEDVGKLSSVDGQLGALGIGYERISGILGKTLPMNELHAAYDSFRWWCAIGRPITAAEVGCALSHYSIYRRMVDENIPWAFIFEDDVVVTEDFNNVLRNVEGCLLKDKPQVVIFSNHGHIDFSGSVPVQEFADGGALYKTPSGTCTEAYCLTLAAAKVLLRQNLPLITPCDHWGRWVKHGGIELYHVLPTTCSQNQAKFGSSTSRGRGTSVADYPLFKWAWHKVKRAIGKSIDAVLTLMTHR